MGCGGVHTVTACGTCWTIQTLPSGLLWTELVDNVTQCVLLHRPSVRWSHLYAQHAHAHVKYILSHNAMTINSDTVCLLVRDARCHFSKTTSPIHHHSHSVSSFSVNFSEVNVNMRYWKSTTYNSSDIWDIFTKHGNLTWNVTCDNTQHGGLVKVCTLSVLSSYNVHSITRSRLIVSQQPRFTSRSLSSANPRGRWICRTGKWRTKKFQGVEIAGL